MYDFNVLPHTTTGVVFYLDPPEVQVNADGTLRIEVWYRPDVVNGSCNIRASALGGEGITVASAKKVLGKTKVKYGRGPRN